MNLSWLRSLRTGAGVVLALLFLLKRFYTKLTYERFFTRVSAFMSCPRLFHYKSLVTVSARIRSLSRVEPSMKYQCGFGWEPFWTILARMRFFSCVSQLMLFVLLFWYRLSCTILALKRFVPSMRSFMVNLLDFCCKWFFTILTLKRTFSCMCSYMFCESYFLCKCLWTMLALKRSLVVMNWLHMQFERGSLIEPFWTLWTFERFFLSMTEKMSVQVRLTLQVFWTEGALKSSSMSWDVFFTLCGIWKLPDTEGTMKWLQLCKGCLFYFLLVLDWNCGSCLFYLVISLSFCLLCMLHFMSYQLSSSFKFFPTFVTGEQLLALKRCPLWNDLSWSGLRGRRSLVTSIGINLDSQVY